MTMEATQTAETPVPRVALVTGASRGIGAEISQHLRQDGWLVIGTATTEAGAEHISRQLGSLNASASTSGQNSPPQGYGRVLDVRDSSAIDALIGSIEAEFGAVLLLVNNAGITRDGLLLRMKPEEWQDIIATHLNSVYYLSRRVLKGMTKVRFGRIISISSVVARMGNPGQTNYCAAKAGVEGFSRALACEMGSRGITVNCVAPGMIETDMTDALNEAQRERMLERIPLNRLGTPADIAAAVCFLASERAGFITGTVLPVNGGMYLD